MTPQLTSLFADLSACRRYSGFSRQMTSLPCEQHELPTGAWQRKSPKHRTAHERRLWFQEVSTRSQRLKLVKRRLGQQTSNSSFYSFASDGNGDIFASMKTSSTGLARCLEDTQDYFHPRQQYLIILRV